MKESKNIGNDNASDVEAIVDSLKMIAKKLENVETQNEDMMRRLDKICENLGDQKLVYEIKLDFVEESLHSRAYFDSKIMT